MKKSLLTICAVLTIAAGIVQADEQDLKAIRETAKAFVEAFNAQDAEAIAALWAEDADYQDDTGLSYEGRDAIEQAYAKSFAEHPERKLDVSVESLRQVGDDVAIEDGIAIVSQPVSGPPIARRYTAVHKREGGKWLLQSVRESDQNVESNYAHLQPLEWLIGSWTGSSPDRTSEMTFEWTKNKNFIKRTFTIKKGDEDYTVTTGTQVIGYDPSTGKIRSWLFDSEAGFSETAWSVGKNGMIGQSTGVLTNGSKAHSKDVLKRVDDDQFTVQSVERTIDGDSVPDGELIEVIRTDNESESPDID